METLLIDLTDIRAYRDVDPNYNETRLQNFVRDVQRKNLRDFLGDSLFYDVMNNPTSANNVKLISGTQYEFEGNNIEFFGLKPALVYWWLAKVAREGDQFLTNYGTASFVNNQQQMFEPAKNKEMVAQEYMATANDYLNDCINYLDTNKIDFPLWDNKKKQTGVKFTMFKV